MNSAEFVSQAKMMGFQDKHIREAMKRYLRTYELKLPNAAQIDVYSPA